MITKFDSCRYSGTAMTMLSEAFKDENYAWFWHCEIVMCIMDEDGISHKSAHKSAARFMKSCFDVDTTKHDRFIY